MIEEFPSNSRRPPIPAREAQPAEPAPSVTPKLEPVVTGKVLRRKKPLGQRLKETFFKGASGGVVEHLVREVVLPALQDMVTDFVRQGIERAVYGEVRSPSRTTTRGASTYPRPHITYNRPVGVQRPAADPPRSFSRPTTARTPGFEIEEVIVASQIEAQTIVDNLFDTVQEYSLATVANLKELLRETPDMIDNKWGWTDLTNMTVQRVREGYLIRLPAPEAIQ